LGTSAYDTAVVAGTVLSLHRWPVKSLAGEPVEELRVDGRGVAGDRTHALEHVFKGERRRLTAREAPRLLAWRATYRGADVDPNQPPAPVLTSPAGDEHAWDDPGLPAVLAADLGREVTLRRDVAGQQDLRDSVLITTAATLAALEAEMGQPVDLRRFRTNVHVELDAAAFGEDDWQGRRITIGEAELELLHPCLRCAIPTRHPDNQVKWAELLRHLTRRHDGIFGVNARPLRPATIRAGDAVRVA
jgi:uncharacterized protein YcbX